MKGSTSKTFYFKEFGTPGSPVIFFFTAFKTRYWLYYPTIRKLVKSGYYVIVYDVNPSVAFLGEAEDFLNLTSNVVQAVRKQVNQLKAQGVKNFFVFAVSMGTLLGLRATADIPEIKKAVANLTYGSLADNIWTWKAMAKIKKRFLGAGITREKLDKLLEPISPVYVAPRLKGKKLLIYLSKKDKVILFSQSLQFKKALDRAGIDHIYRQNNKFGHYISGAINNLRAKVYLDFLKSD